MPNITPASAAARRFSAATPKPMFDAHLPASMAAFPPPQPTVALPGYESMVPAESKDATSTLAAIKAAREKALGPDASGPMAAAGRVLQGFSRGFAATPASAAYNPGAAGVVGGIAGTGDSFAAEAERRRRAAEPYDKLLADATSKQLEQDVLAPGKARDRDAETNKEKALFDYKASKNAELARSMGEEKGLPHDVAVDIDKEAKRALLAQGVGSDDPAYQGKYAAAFNEALAKRKAANVNGARRGRELPVPQQDRPSLDSILLGGGL